MEQAIQINPHYVYEIIDYKGRPLISTADFNIEAGRKGSQLDEHEFIFGRSRLLDKTRLMTYRKDLGSRIHVGVEPFGNAITWTREEDNSQDFTLVGNPGGIAFREGTRGEFLDVDPNGNNVRRWTGNGNRPKENQLFTLRQGKKWTPNEIPNELKDFLHRYPQEYGKMIHTFLANNFHIAPELAAEMKEKIKHEHWMEIIQWGKNHTFTVDENGQPEDKSGYLYKLLVSIGFLAGLIIAGIIAILGLIAVIITTTALAPLIIGAIIAILSIFGAYLAYSLSLLTLWWDDLNPENNLIQVAQLDE